MYITHKKYIQKINLHTYDITYQLQDIKKYHLVVIYDDIHHTDNE